MFFFSLFLREHIKQRKIKFFSNIFFNKSISKLLGDRSPGGRGSIFRCCCLPFSISHTNRLESWIATIRKHWKLFQIRIKASDRVFIKSHSSARRKNGIVDPCFLNTIAFINVDGNAWKHLERAYFDLKKHWLTCSRPRGFFHLWGARASSMPCSLQ